MRASSFVAPFFFIASSLAQAVEEGVAPDVAAPEGCKTTVKGNFTIGVQNFFAPREKRETAQEAADGLLLCTLEDGVLRDQNSRTGSIVANHQFQFDGPPQAGAIYTGGFSVCQNNSLAIGDSSRWWRCMSGEFGNLYDMWIGEQCTEIRIIVDMIEKPSSSSSSVILASSTRASDLPLATSGTLTGSAVSSLASHSSHASHSMTSGASTAEASQTGSVSISSSATTTRSSSTSSGTSVITVPEAPEANGSAPLVEGATLWSILLTVGVAWAL